MTETRLLVESKAGITRVRLARPQARNAVDLAMCEALSATFAEIDADPHVRVVLIEAEGRVFCAGADLKERDGKDAAWVRRRRQASFAAYAAIEACTVPVVGVVQGPAIGSGGELALCCDFVIASEAASFKFPEPQWGTVGATQRLQRAIGKRGAKELLFTGRSMPVAEALQRGLVARVVPPEGLSAAVDELAAIVAAAPPLAMRLTKRSIDLGSTTDLASGIQIEMSAVQHNLDSGEWRSGIEKFKQRGSGGEE